MSDVLRELVLPLLDAVKPSGGGFVARCPAHEDHRASLTVSRGDRQPVVTHCHAGCDPEDIVRALGLDWADLSEPREHDDPLRVPDVVYDYTDEHGALLFQVVRKPGKQFRQRRPDGGGGWVWKLDGVRRVLYRLPAVIEAVAEGREIWCVEGERDVNTLVKRGVDATCNPQGAGKWRPEFAEPLRDAIVTIVADRDEPGRAHARTVRDTLAGVATFVRIVEPAAGKDITDHLDAGFELDQVTVTWEQDPPAAPELAPDLWDFIKGSDEYHWLMPGYLERGDRLIITGLEGLGKALDVDTPIATPKGWTTMGQLNIGDEVFGPDGQPTRIVAATPVLLGRPCYRLRFSDGAEIVADAWHKWRTETLKAREAVIRYAKRPETTALRGTDQRHLRRHFPTLVTTEQIAATLHARGGHALNHSIATCQPLQYPAQELPIHPYVLGAWLGDGDTAHAEITCTDPAILMRIAVQHGVPIKATTSPHHYRLTRGRGGGRGSSIQAALRRLGVLGDKHIPAAYLHASVEQRLELLRGLMDTDGTVQQETRGAAVCEFSVTNERLARHVRELLLGLGVKVTWRQGPAVLDGRTVGTRYRLAFQTDLAVFHLPRKAKRQTVLRTRRAKLRYVSGAEPMSSVPVRCIQVDRPDGMYVAGWECIPTHNTMLVRQIGVMAACGLDPFRPLTREAYQPATVLVVDCENPERLSRRRFRVLAEASLTAQRRVPAGGVRVIHHPAGLDLTRGPHAEYLMERVTAHAPDILIIGPLYKLHNTNINDEQAARQVAMALDAARAVNDSALIIEAHSGLAQNGDGQRELRPVGSSLFLRWPELGFGIRPKRVKDGDRTVTDPRHVEVRPWRGSREERDWPDELEWGPRGAWPWQVPIGQTPML